MRKPRDIDAELRALATKTKELKSRKITQLGELVIATGADALEPEVLAGVLISALETKAPSSRQDWKAKGQAFFRKGEGRKLAGSGVNASSDRQSPGSNAAG